MNHTTVSRALRTLFVAAGLLTLTAPAGVALAATTGWFHSATVHGSGKITRQTREIGHFTALTTSVPGNVEIRIGNSEGITIETDDNLQPLIETVVEDGTLRIRPAKNNLSLETRTMRIVVQAKSLERIAVAGSGSVDAAQLRGDNLQFDVGGSGSINLRGLDSAQVTVSLGGSGSLDASGKTEQLKVSIGGSGQVHAEQLAARTAAVSIGGSGQATVWATQSLKLSVAGSGDIGYYGDPQLTKSVMGSGSVKRLGAAPK